MLAAAPNAVEVFCTVLARGEVMKIALCIVACGFGFGVVVEVYPHGSSCLWGYRSLGVGRAARAEKAAAGRAYLSVSPQSFRRQPT